MSQKKPSEKSLTEPYAAVLDANINRIGEGLRVIEEYTRFIIQDTSSTQIIAQFRQDIRKLCPQSAPLLQIRNIDHDVRAKEPPKSRTSIRDLLTANFKRVEEALRVMEEYTNQPEWNSIRYDIYTLEKNILLPLHHPEIKRGVYVVSDDIDILLKATQMGAIMVQLRGKTDSKATLYNKAQTYLAKRTHTDIPFIINDHLDIAISVKADGLHTGQDDISPSIQRQLLGDTMIIGKTTHSFKQGQQAKADGAHYVSVGPLWDTPSKPNRPGIGLDYLKQAHELELPFVAIGGINKERALECAAYSPYMIGVIRAYEEVLNEKLFN